MFRGFFFFGVNIVLTEESESIFVVLDYLWEDQGLGAYFFAQTVCKYGREHALFAVLLLIYKYVTCFKKKN